MCSQAQRRLEIDNKGLERWLVVRSTFPQDSSVLPNTHIRVSKPPATPADSMPSS